MSDKKIQQQLATAQGNKYIDYYGLKLDKLSQTPKNNMNDSRRNDITVGGGGGTGSHNNSLSNLKKQA